MLINVYRNLTKGYTSYQQIQLALLCLDIERKYYHKNVSIDQDMIFFYGLSISGLPHTVRDFTIMIVPQFGISVT